jgi:hypothetical protein
MRISSILTTSPQEKSPQYPLNKRLDGPQSRSGHGGKHKNPYPSQRSNPLVQPIVGDMKSLISISILNFNINK